MTATDRADKSRAGKALYELLKVEVYRGNLARARITATTLGENLRSNSVSAKLILEENPYESFSIHRHAFQEPEFSGLIKLFWLAKAVNNEPLIDAARDKLLHLIHSKYNNDIKNSLSYYEAGRQLSFIGLNSIARIFFMKRIEVCRNELGNNASSIKVSLVAQSLFDLYFTYEEEHFGEECSKIFDEIDTLVRKHPASFSGSGPITTNLRRLFSERGIKWPA